MSAKAKQLAIPPVKPKAIPVRDIVRMLEYQTEQRIQAETKPKVIYPPIPDPVRHAYRELQRNNKRNKTLVAFLRRKGFTTGYNGKLTRTDPPGNDWHSKRSARITALHALRAQALIDLIGRTPEETRTYLLNFQTTLRTL